MPSLRPVRDVVALREVDGMSHPPADTSRTASRWVADHPGDLPPGEGDLFLVKADTVAQLVASRTVVYGLTCAFMLLSVETWWAVVARSLRVCSAAKIDHIHVAAS